MPLGWQRDGVARSRRGPASLGSRARSPDVRLPRASQMTPFSDWPRLMASSPSGRARAGGAGAGFSGDAVLMLFLLLFRNF